MATHTAGPWRVAYNDENGQAVVSGEHTEIATCWHHCVGRGMWKVNDKAIAVRAALTGAA